MKLKYLFLVIIIIIFFIFIGCNNMEHTNVQMTAGGETDKISGEADAPVIDDVTDNGNGLDNAFASIVGLPVDNVSLCAIPGAGEMDDRMMHRQLSDFFRATSPIFAIVRVVGTEQGERTAQSRDIEGTALVFVK